ncbi:peptidoglycan DD-metalloendopeptidase family protein [Microbacterium sp.]|uniref:peptidoglycan DD-metalloendopeptidase family protein n=1 Tax=Microbacterium sp. TaxID=51671 RepID=UPI002CA072DD|nr:peptidoglycan DD-metalloendopeptidase family protein [Microbacterium sp.]HWL78043.1 peptidoglycan DD-metalloendopeptidase family protein [Microbacterium sp.]
MLPTRPDDPDCGCGPTPAEQKKLFGAVTRRTALTAGLLSAVLIGAGPVAGVAPAAVASEADPTWEDVQRARANTAAKSAEVARILKLIEQLEAKVAEAEQAARDAGDEFHEAQQAFFDAAIAADELQTQADAADEDAQDAGDRIGRIVGRQYREGSVAPLALLTATSAAEADSLLNRLSALEMIRKRNEALYGEAFTAKNTAQSLADQAKEKQKERDRLFRQAERKMKRAQRAADAAQATLARHQERLETLKAQLAALTDSTGKTVSEYEAGVNAEKAARAERERKAREQAGNVTGGGGSAAPAPAPTPPPTHTPTPTPTTPPKTTPPPTTPPVVNPPAPVQTWSKPVRGTVKINSGFGPRTTQCGPSYCSSGYHYGSDVNASCYADILAVAAGKVVYAGWNGGYGNFVKIDHGGGLATGYAHIANGTIKVTVGQQVKPGDLIAGVGNTGNSFGCHLHFEVYKSGTPINPEPWLRARGLL